MLLAGTMPAQSTGESCSDSCVGTDLACLLHVPAIAWCVTFKKGSLVCDSLTQRCQCVCQGVPDENGSANATWNNQSIMIPRLQVDRTPEYSIEAKIGSTAHISKDSITGLID